MEHNATEAEDVKESLVTYFLLVWAAIMAIQAVRAVLYAIGEPTAGWKIGWVLIAAFYAFVAYGTWRAFVALRRPKNSN